MRTFIIALAVSTFAVSSFAGCEVNIGLAVDHTESNDSNLSKILTKALEKKGYSVTDSGAADIQASLMVGSTIEECAWNCETKTAVLKLAQDRGQVHTFFGNSEDGFVLKGSSKSAVNKALKQIPECHKL